MGPQRTTNALAIAASSAFGVALTGFVIVRSAALCAVFGGLAVYTTLEWVKRRREEVDLQLGLPQQVRSAAAVLAQGRPREALETATGVLKCARSKSTRRRASEVIAWCSLELGRPDHAWRVLVAAGPLPALDVGCRAAVEEARGREPVAIEILEHARRGEGLPAEAIKRLVDIYVRQGRFDLACQVTRDEVARLEADDARRVIDVAVEAGALAGAADIASALFAARSAPDDGITLAYVLARCGQPKRACEVLQRVASLSEGAIGADAQRRLTELGHQTPFAEVIAMLLTRTAQQPST
jgi:hypothetical protein